MVTITAEVARSPGVRAEVNYVRNLGPGPGKRLAFVIRGGGALHDADPPGEAVWIADARPVTTELDRAGLVLVRHVSSIGDFDRIQEDPAIDRRLARLSNAKPARYPHADNTECVGDGHG